MMVKKIILLTTIVIVCCSILFFTFVNQKRDEKVVSKLATQVSPSEDSHRSNGKTFASTADRVNGGGIVVEAPKDNDTEAAAPQPDDSPINNELAKKDEDPGSQRDKISPTISSVPENKTRLKEATHESTAASVNGGDIIVVEATGIAQKNTAGKATTPQPDDPKKEDEAPRESSDTLQDKTSPTVSIVPENGALLECATPLIKINYADGDGSGVDVTTLHIQINGVDRTSLFNVTANEANWQLSSSNPLLSGENVIAVAVADKAGNQKDAASVITYADRTLPTLAVSPATGTQVTHFTPVIAIEYADDSGQLDITSLQVEINGENCTSSFNVAANYASWELPLENPLKLGANTVTAKISDQARNEISETVIFQVVLSPASLTVPENERNSYTIVANPQMGVNLKAWGRDTKSKPIGRLAVLFKIINGSGTLEGTTEKTVYTDCQGSAVASFSPDKQEGTAEVTASLPDFPEIEKLNYTVNKVWYERLSPIHIGSPAAVAVDNSENIYVASSDHNRLYIYDKNGKQLKSLSGLANPISITVSDEKKIFIGNDGRKNVEVYSDNLTMLYKLGQGDGEFTQPNAIAVDGNGNVYVADSKDNKIKIYNADGSYDFSFGIAGNSDGQFNFPSSIAISKATQELIIPDRPLVQSRTGLYHGARIQVFDMNGNFRRKFASYGQGDGMLIRPHAVNVDPGGRIYVTDVVEGIVQIFNSYGGFLKTIQNEDSPMRQPLGVAISTNYTLVLACYSSRNVEMYRVSVP